MSNLAYLRMWWALGFGWIALIVYLSLADLSLPQITFSFGDKVNHAIAYGFLMGWFGQLINKGKSWWLLATTLVVLGALMEICQSLLSHRWFDPADAVANTIGVLVGWLVLRAGGDKVLVTLERWCGPA